MATYLVTGGCGFIGSHLCDFLVAKGHQVIVLDDLSTGRKEQLTPSAELVVGDVTDITQVNAVFDGIDGCFHLAAIPSVVFELKDWSKLHALNLGGTLNVLQAAATAGNIPVVYASSCAVYGNNSNLPLHEKQYIEPISAYGCDKYASELNARFITENYLLPTFGARIFNVFGPRQNPNSPYSGVISRFIQAALTHSTLTIFGDGEQTRDFTYVQDVVEGLYFGMQQAHHKRSNVMNICTGNTTSINQLASSIISLCNSNANIEHQAARTYDVTHSCGDTTHAKSLGFESNANFEASLRDTIDYSRKQLK